MPVIPFPRQKTVNSAMGDAPTSQTPTDIHASPHSATADSTPATKTTSTALLRVYSPASGDHFYTTSVAEQENAVAKLGYVDEGVACHVYSN
jgi:hypothetical protein